MNEYANKNNTPQPRVTEVRRDTRDWTPVSADAVRPMKDAYGTVVGYLISTKILRQCNAAGSCGCQTGPVAGCETR